MKNIGGGSWCSQVVVVVQWFDNSIQSNIVSGNAYMKLLYQALTISINVNDGSVAVFSYVRLWNYTAMHQLLLCSYIDRWAWVSLIKSFDAQPLIPRAALAGKRCLGHSLSLSGRVLSHKRRKGSSLVHEGKLLSSEAINYVCIST